MRLSACYYIRMYTKVVCRLEDEGMQIALVEAFEFFSISMLSLNRLYQFNYMQHLQISNAELKSL